MTLDFRWQDVPFPDRPYTKVEKVLEEQLADRDPAGTGEVLLFIVEDNPYLAIPNDDLSGWIVAPLNSATYIGNGKVVVGKTGATPVAVEQRDYKVTALLDVNPADQDDNSVLVWDEDDEEHKYTLFDLAMLGDVDTTGRDDGSMLAWHAASSKYKHVHPVSDDLADLDTSGRANNRVVVWDNAASQNKYVDVGGILPHPKLLSSQISMTSDRTFVALGTVPWDAEDWDDLAGFNVPGTSAGDEFTAPATGYYQHTFALTLSANHTIPSIGVFGSGGLSYSRTFRFLGSSLVLNPTQYCWTITVFMTAGQRIGISTSANTVSGNTVTFFGNSTPGVGSTWTVTRLS